MAEIKPRHDTNMTSQPLVSKKGWLCIQEDINKNFQLRWFILKGNLLLYYERCGSTEPIGVIILEACYIELAKDDIIFCFKIGFFGPNNGSYMLGANSQESRVQWMMSLKYASYNCVESIVANLESSLKKLEEKNIQISHPIKIIEPKRSLSFENISLPSTSGLRLLHHIVPFGRRSRSPSPSHKTQGYAPSITFKTLHREYGKSILKDRNERLRLNKNKMFHCFTNH